MSEQDLDTFWYLSIYWDLMDLDTSQSIELLEFFF